MCLQPSSSKSKPKVPGDDKPPKVVYFKAFWDVLYLTVAPLLKVLMTCRWSSGRSFKKTNKN